MSGWDPNDLPDPEEYSPKTKVNSAQLEEFNRIYGAKKPKRRRKPAKKNKKNAQLKINQFYPDKENGEGYPLKHCQYEPTEGRMVYRPPGYGDDPSIKWHHRQPPHCLSCHLKPCITTDRFNEMSDQASTQKILEKKPKAVVIDATNKSLMRHYCKLMKRPYHKNLKPPVCVTDFSNRLVFSDTESDTESIDHFIFNDTDSDDDSIFNNEYYFPKYLCTSLLRDRQIGDPPMKELVAAAISCKQRQQRETLSLESQVTSNNEQPTSNKKHLPSNRKKQQPNRKKQYQQQQPRQQSHPAKSQLSYFEDTSSDEEHTSSRVINYPNPHQILTQLPLTQMPQPGKPKRVSLDPQHQPASQEHPSSEDCSTTRKKRLRSGYSNVSVNVMLSSTQSDQEYEF